MAMDIADLCSFELRESWTEVLFAVLVRGPSVGFQRVSVDQLARAGRELWTRVAERCLAGIRPEPDGTRPFETALKNLILLPRSGFCWFRCQEVVATQAVRHLPASALATVLRQSGN